MMNDELVRGYFDNLVNRFFKILPMREENEVTLIAYMQSLQAELIGCDKVVRFTNNDSSILTLINILQFLIDNVDESPRVFKREVFRSISMCEKLRDSYPEGEV